MCHTFEAVLATLEDVADGDDHAKAVEASGFLLQVKSFTFHLNLMIFDRILCCTKKLSDLLQSQGCDLAKSTELVSATIETFEEFRSDSSWNQIFPYAEKVAKVHRITSSFHRSDTLSHLSDVRTMSSRNQLVQGIVCLPVINTK